MPLGHGTRELEPLGKAVNNTADYSAVGWPDRTPAAMSSLLDGLKPTLRLHLNAGAAIVVVGDTETLAAFDPRLTPNERTRFDRVIVPKQRRTHALGHGLVRHLLNLPTTDFLQTPNGKPWVADAEFNISHSGALITVAIHQSRPVGVDVEVMSRHVRANELMDRICHPAEKNWINQHQPSERDHAFLRCWVRKEALLKATGTGLVDDLQAIDTLLHRASPIVTFKKPQRLWDLPQGTSTLATDPEIDRVVFASLCCDGVVTMSLDQEGNVRQS